MTFNLHPALAKKTHVGNLPLCMVLLEDDVYYPWLMLVPRRNMLVNLLSVAEEDQSQLFFELHLAQRALVDLYSPTQLNVAAIGNKTPQLHIHVIARFSHDPAWPGTMWDHPVRSRYSLDQKEKVVADLRGSFLQWLRV